MFVLLAIRQRVGVPEDLHFLFAHPLTTGGHRASREQPHRENELARPDAVLFNGGFCAPEVTRQRIAEAISAWFGESRRPKILDNAAVESAVARGAAYYGRVRRGGLHIRAGSART